MEIKKLLNEWKQDKNQAEIFKLFEQQDDEALDIIGVSDLKLDSKKLDTVKVTFKKNTEKYVLEFKGVTKLAVEQSKKVKQKNTILCIRNGMETLNFVIAYQGTIISFNFISGTLAKSNLDTKLQFNID